MKDHNFTMTAQLWSRGQRIGLYVLHALCGYCGFISPACVLKQDTLYLFYPWTGMQMVVSSAETDFATDFRH